MRPAILPLLAVALATHAAHAGEPAPRVLIELSFTQGPAASCTDEEGFKRDVVEFVSCDPFRASAPLRLDVSVTRSRGEFVGTIALRDETGRVLWENSTAHAPNDCAGVVKAMAFKLARQLDAWPKAWVCPPPPAEAPPAPSADPASSPADPTPPSADLAPSPSADPAPSPSAEPAPPSAPPKRAFRLDVGVDAIVIPKLTPSASVGFAPFVTLRADSWSLPSSLEVGMRAAWTPGSAAETGYRVRALVRASYVSFVLAPCVRSKFFVFACAVFEAGALNFSQDSSHGYVVVGAPRPTVIAAGMRIGGEVPFAEGWAVRVWGEAEGVPVGPRFHLQAADEAAVWTTPSLSGNVGIGLVVKLW